MGNTEMKIAEDLCPSCSHIIEVFVPQPYASGPELLEALELIHSEMEDRCPGYVLTAIAKAKGGRNGY